MRLSTGMPDVSFTYVSVDPRSCMNVEFFFLFAPFICDVKSSFRKGMWEKRQNTRFLNGIPQDETVIFSLFSSQAQSLTALPSTFSTDVVSKLPWTPQSNFEVATDTNTTPTETASTQTSNINAAPTTSPTTSTISSQTAAIIADAPISSPSKTINLTSGAVAGIAIGA